MEPNFHLLVNHLPVVGFVVVIPALLFALLTKSYDIKRFVLVMTTIVGLSALSSYWTGEPAEETIEHLPGVDKKLIHEHEEAAEWATVLSVVTAVSAAGSLLLMRRKSDSMQKAMPIVLGLSLITGAAMAKTAHEGGKIRHPEIRDAGTGSSGASSDNDGDD